MGKQKKNKPAFVPMSDARQSELLELSHDCVRKGVNAYLGHIHIMHNDKEYRKAHPNLLEESNVARDKSAEALHSAVVALSEYERVDMLVAMLYPSVDANTRTALLNLANTKGANKGAIYEGKEEPKG